MQKDHILLPPLFSVYDGWSIATHSVRTQYHSSSYTTIPSKNSWESCFMCQVWIKKMLGQEFSCFAKRHTTRNWTDGHGRQCRHNFIQYPKFHSVCWLVSFTWSFLFANYVKTGKCRDYLSEQKNWLNSNCILQQENLISKLQTSMVT